MPSSKNIVLMVAMDVEEASILKQSKYTTISISKPLQINAKQMTFKNLELYILKSGVGTVNAAITLAMFEMYLNKPIECVILLGVCGSITSELKSGDVVVATHICQHDFIISLENGIQRVFPGELYLSIPEDKRLNPILQTNEIWTDKILKILSEKKSLNIKKGLVLSGNEFVGTHARKNELKRFFPDALVAEMESAGVFQVSKKLKVPLVVVKTVADEDLENGIAQHYVDWIGISCHAAETVVDGLIKELYR